MQKCPNCGFEQDGGEECRKCGIIFSKFRQPAAPTETRASYQDAPQTQDILQQEKISLRKRKPLLFWGGIVVAALMALAMLGAVMQFTMRKVALDRFDAQLNIYDAKKHALETKVGVDTALNDLFILYDSAAESTPFFNWKTFDPNSKSGKIYTSRDIDHILAKLRPRKTALLDAIRKGAESGNDFGHDLKRIGLGITAYEYCLIGKLIRDRKDAADMDLAAVFSGVDCKDVKPGRMGYAGSDAGNEDGRPFADRNYLVKKDAYHENRSQIMNSLVKISSMKRLWGKRNKAEASAVPTGADLAPFGEFPNKPEGAEYTINALDQSPICVYKGMTYKLN
jgi:hypothetical protein